MVSALHSASLLLALFLASGSGCEAAAAKAKRADGRKGGKRLSPAKLSPLPKKEEKEKAGSTEERSRLTSVETCPAPKWREPLSSALARPARLTLLGVCVVGVEAAVWPLGDARWLR